MSRITERIQAAEKAFIPFITAGDPDIETSLAILLKLAELGADVIELGVPFSDPMADGATIQRASQRALANGTTVRSVLGLARTFRAESDVPLVLFSYFNPILRFGTEKFRTAAADARIDAVLITDVIENEAAVLSREFAEAEIDLISLIAPTTSDKRLEQICGDARGFIYAVSRAGVTGERADTSSEAERLVTQARKFTDLPIAVGFGISTREQVTDVWRFADGAVVGSAIVAEIERAASPRDAIRRVEAFVRELLPQVAKAGGEN